MINPKDETERAKNSPPPPKRTDLAASIQFRENEDLRRHFLQNDLKSELSKYHTLITGHTSSGWELESPCCWRESDTEMFSDLGLQIPAQVV